MARRSASIRRACGAAALLLAACSALAQRDPDTEEWLPLFNGRDLDGWIVKIRGHELGDNYADTFRVDDGLLTVSYDGYADFDDRYGHLFYEEPFSHYRLRVEYRFIGAPAPRAAEWAYRNSGAMLHSQAPATMARDQDFPISVEFQFLGGLGDGRPRPTGNVCSPGTHVVHRGRLEETHCIESSSGTYDGDQWVTAEALVEGRERIVHLIAGEPVIEYGDIVYGGGVVSGHRPEAKPDGQPLASGFIALQSEGHPIQFRLVELLNLKGCMDTAALNYKRYYVEPDAGSCISAQEPNVLTDDERRAGWALLFDGRSLAGWRGYNRGDLPAGWAVDDGALARVGPGGDIITTQQYGDFELAFEWKVATGGNSGLFYRAAEGEEWIYQSAPEMQLLDDANHADGRSPLTSAGASYGLYGAPRGVVRPAGEWNRARVLVDGSRVEHWLNGAKVVEYELGSGDWQARVASSKFAAWPQYGRARRGHIGLQDHGDPVWFRNLKIRLLEP